MAALPAVRVQDKMEWYGGMSPFEVCFPTHCCLCHSSFCVNQFTRMYSLLSRLSFSFLCPSLSVPSKDDSDPSTSLSSGRRNVTWVITPNSPMETPTAAQRSVPGFAICRYPFLSTKSTSQMTSAKPCFKLSPAACDDETSK